MWMYPVGLGANRVAGLVQQFRVTPSQPPEIPVPMPPWSAEKARRTPTGRSCLHQFNETETEFD
jgi:hypothetical protein